MHWLQEKELREKIQTALAIYPPEEKNHLLLKLDQLFEESKKQISHIQRLRELVDELTELVKELSTVQTMKDARLTCVDLDHCCKDIVAQINQLL